MDDSVVHNKEDLKGDLKDLNDKLRTMFSLTKIDGQDYIPVTFVERKCQEENSYEEPH